MDGVRSDAVYFTFSPMQEVLRALKVFVSPRPHAEQMAWLRHARRRATPPLKRASTRFRSLLMPTPELFVNILPSSKAVTFAQELALLGRSRRAFREAMVRRFIGKPLFMRADITARARAEALSRLAAETSAHDTEEALADFCDLLHEFFERCLASHWDQFEFAARRDSRAREELLRRFGVTSVLRTLTRDLTAKGDRNTAAVEFGGKESKGGQLNFPPDGRLLLTPSYFIWPHSAFVILRRDTVDIRIAYPLAAPSPSARHAMPWEPAAKRFAALGDPTRLRILDLLSNRDLSTRELAGMLGISEGGVSRHLSVLYDTGLVQRQRDSYFVLYRLTALASAMLVRVVASDGTETRRREHS